MRSTTIARYVAGLGLAAVTLAGPASAAFATTGGSTDSPSDSGSVTAPPSTVAQPATPTASATVTTPATATTPRPSGVPSSAVPPYAGPKVTAAWQLAPGINADNLMTTGKQLPQKYYGPNAPGCTSDGTTSFQVDTLKNDVTHKPIVDRLIKGGVLYLAPLTPNDGAAYLGAEIVTPPRCKPDKPAPVVEKKVEQKYDCDFYYERTVTATTPWAWDEKTWSWIKDKPVNKTTDWSKVRPITPLEKAKQGCAKPEQPKPVVVTKKDVNTTCDGVKERVITTTTSPEWAEDKYDYVMGKPVITMTDWSKVRDLTEAEKKAAGCAMPAPTPAPTVTVQPAPVVVEVPVNTPYPIAAGTDVIASAQTAENHTPLFWGLGVVGAATAGATVLLMNDARRRRQMADVTNDATS